MSIQENLKLAFTKVWDRICYQISIQFCDRVRNQVSNQIESQVWNQVRDQVDRKNNKL